MEKGRYREEYQRQVEQYLKLVMLKKGEISQRELADMMGQSLQNLNQKIKRGSLNSTELWKIADVLGCQVVFADKRTGKVII